MRTATQQCLRWAFALVLLLAIGAAHADTSITLMTVGTLTYEVGVMGSTPSRTIAQNMCADRGGILPADATSNVQSGFATGILTTANGGSRTLCQATSTGWTTNCYGTYTAGTAATSGCTDNVRTSYSASNWDTGCNYRWTVGWYGRYINSAGVEGIDFWQSTWANLRSDGTNSIYSESAMRTYRNTLDAMPASSVVHASGALHDYSRGLWWNASYQCTGSGCGPQSIPPHGRLYIALGARNLRDPTASSGATVLAGMRVDVPAIAGDDNIPFAKSSYVLMCQWQGVEASYYDSTLPATQYAFVQGWKNLTWAQSHWWVIFIIVAAVILIILFIILIFCCCTRKPLPEGELISAMSMREREGSLYVVMDEEVDEELDESKGTVTTTSVLTNPRFVSGNSAGSGQNPFEY